ncbi:MAG: hypothetical protein BIFFINMI_01802 [Phycisphaerae bacterium]|nr:hypothetical protein [Phycisphaerae bacterium]
MIIRTARLAAAFTLVAAVMLAGCSRPEQADSKAGDSAKAPAPKSAPASTTPTQAPTPPAATGQVAEVGDHVKVHYTGKLEDGSVFDTSRKARAPGQPITPLAFTVGAGEMIKAFDAGVRGMKLGETRKIVCPPTDAYGEYNPKLVRDYPRAQLEQQLGDKVEAGMELMAGGGQQVKVTKVTADTVTIDMNHPLAGKTLYFEVELVELVKGH